MSDPTNQRATSTANLCWFTPAESLPCVPKYKPQLGNEVFTSVVLFTPLQSPKNQSVAAQLRLLSTLFFKSCFFTSCFHMKQLASAQNDKSVVYPFVHLPKKASWSAGLIRVSRASFAKQKQSKQTQVLLDCCLREHSYWFGKHSSAFLCDFSFYSLHWEFYRGSCIVPFVALMNFMGNSAGPWVNLFRFIWVLPHQSNLELL